MAFKDYFSEHTAGYASHRPHYPAAMFAWLAQQCPAHDLAWDCATGNGQAAMALAAYFDHIIATDASQAQLREVTPANNIHYVCASAEQAPLASHSLDLISVAQAAHWFELSHFYDEVDRLLVPHGMLALWCYGLFHITPAIDALIQDYYQHTVGNYWPPERHHVEQAYDSIDFPYEQRQTPAFNMQVTWNLQQVMGYLATWSATRLYKKATGKDPLTALAEAVSEIWGESKQARVVQWPLHIKLGSKA